MTALRRAGQGFPYPTDLALMVEAVRGRPGWRFTLDERDRGQGCGGLTLTILITTPNAYDTEQERTVAHLFPVPAAAYDGRSWRRWLFNCCCAVDLHEQMEWFAIDGHKPYAPHHGPGNDPYIVFEHGTDLDVRTAYTGRVNEPA